MARALRNLDPGWKQAMTPKMVRTLVAHLGKAGAFGMMLGLGAGLLSFGAKLKQVSSDDLDFSIEHLKVDSQMLEAFLNLKQFRDIQMPESNEHFEAIGRACDKLMQSSMGLQSSDVKNPGVLSFRAHRFAVEIRQHVAALQSICNKKSQADVTPLDFDHHRQLLLKHVDNCIHNICMSSPYKPEAPGGRAAAFKA